MSKQVVHVNIDVEFCGKTYENANYVQGSTVEESYLRWVPFFGVHKNSGRKASIHMTLHLSDGSLLEADASKRFPADAERVVFWSGSGWAPGCVVCARLAAEKLERQKTIGENASVPESLLWFHRAEVPVAQHAEADDEVVVPPELEAKKKTKSRRKKCASQASGNSAPLPAAVGGSVEDVSPEGDADLDDDEIEETQVETLTPADGQQNLATLEESRCLQTPAVVEESSVPQERSSLLPLQSAQTEMCIASHDVSEDHLDAPFRQLGWRVQSEHSRSMEFEDADDPDLHTVVEQLAGVVRNLATVVRETSTNVAKLQETGANLAAAVGETSANVTKLQEVAAMDHEALQKHLLEAREDRQVMLKLLSVLASGKEESPLSIARASS